MDQMKEPDSRTPVQGLQNQKFQIVEASEKNSADQVSARVQYDENREDLKTQLDDSIYSQLFVLICFP